MTQIQITNIINSSNPCNLYICDVYENNCVFITVINSSVPPTLTILLPSPFNTAPAILIKIEDANTCILKKIIYCGSIFTEKLFQNDTTFEFQDATVYNFPN